MRLNSEGLPSVISNYLKVQEFLSIDEINLFQEVFSCLSEFRLKSTNVYIDGKIYDGLFMIPEKKNVKSFEDFDLDAVSTEILKKTAEIDDIKDAYFVRSLMSLIENYKYIAGEEAFLLNSIYGEILFSSVDFFKDEETKSYYIK